MIIEPEFIQKEEVYPVYRKRITNSSGEIMFKWAVKNKTEIIEFFVHITSKYEQKESYICADGGSYNKEELYREKKYAESVCKSKNKAEEV